ncbi:MAG: CCDC90 family protein [Bacteroides sp.]|nr:CCDC90 family protein [Eubacterium sp.]MCM1417291.1 CCDC90 family protein [Roseburia sp.]MCM1461089.1 CCDC90 family protein [Bacteroides sp.]
MKMANAVEKIEQLSRESERQKIEIETLKAENDRLKAEIEQLKQQIREED